MVTQAASRPHLNRPADSSACLCSDRITELDVFAAIVRLTGRADINPESFDNSDIQGALAASASARVQKGLEKESLSSNQTR